MAVGTGYDTSNTEIAFLDIRRTLNGIWVGTDGFDLRLENILLSEIKDTCIIADHDGDLTVDNVFFDRCARVVKLESQSAGSTLTIRNSLIRINNRQMSGLQADCSMAARSSSKLQVYFENNVVVTAAELDARSLSILETNCSDNSLIWVGEGDYPGDLPGCFTVIKGKEAWREARLAWCDSTKRSSQSSGTSGS